MVLVDCPRITEFSRIFYYVGEGWVRISGQVKLHLLHQFKSIHFVVLKANVSFSAISLVQH